VALRYCPGFYRVSLTVVMREVTALRKCARHVSEINLHKCHRKTLDMYIPLWHRKTETTQNPPTTIQYVSHSAFHTTCFGHQVYKYNILWGQTRNIELQPSESSHFTFCVYIYIYIYKLTAYITLQFIFLLIFNLQKYYTSNTQYKHKKPLHRFRVNLF